MSETRFHDRFLERSAPVRYRGVAGLRINARSTVGGGPRSYVVRSRGGGTCQLGEEEHCLLSLLDGTRSLGEIETEFRARFAGNLSLPQFQAFIDELLDAGIIERVADEAPADTSEKKAALHIALVTDASLPTVEDGEPVAVPASPQPIAAAGRLGPRPVFLLLSRLGSPLRYFAWLLPAAAAAAGTVLYGVEPQAIATLRATDWSMPGAGGAAIAAVFAAVLVPGLVRGAVAAFHGHRAALPALPRKARVWCCGGPLLARIALFVLGASLWASRGDGHGPLALFGLLLGEIGLWSFLLAACPLWPGDGYRWIRAYFAERPADALGERAERAGGAPNPGRTRVFLATAGVISLLGIAGAGLPWLGVLRGASLSIIGAAMLGGAYAAALSWLLVARIVAGPLREPSYPARGAIARRSLDIALPEALGRPLSLDERLFAGAESWPPLRRALTLAALVALLISILFLPYPYQSGGSFAVLPADRYTLLARVGGEITEVLVREGERVQEGQVVATLSDWDEVHNIALAKAELEESLAKLQDLLISPKPEEVEVARRQYEQALARIPFSKTDYERKLALVKTNATSVRDFELAESTYAQDQAAVGVTKANYDLVRVGPTQPQIAAARAAVQHANAQAAFWQDQLDRTRIRATAAGEVVTPDPQLMMGKYLKDGDPFIQIEDHAVAHVEIQVPEDDIREIHVGSQVRAKAWGYEHQTWPGKVRLIAPDAQPNASFGNVVRVVADIPNPKGLLRPAMSGYAKVETVNMPVWESFTRAVVRFLLIEFWSWIP